MELSKKEKMMLQKVVDDSCLEILTRIANLLLVKQNQGQVMAETAFLTAAEAIKREERKNFIRIFLQEIERIAHE